MTWHRRAISRSLHVDHSSSLSSFEPATRIRARAIDRADALLKGFDARGDRLVNVAATRPGPS